MDEEDRERLIVRAAQALAMGASIGDVVESFVAEGVPVEEAHLATRAGELYLGMQEEFGEEEDMEDDGSPMIENSAPIESAQATENSKRKRKRQGATAAKYYVFETGKKKRPELVSRGPLTLQSAKSFARVGATYGKHDRVITTDPKKKDFSVIAKYKAGSGKQVRVR